jgi:hypothetical protein
MSMKTDSKKKKRANPGSRKDIDLFWRLATLTEFMISTMSQIRLIIGTNTNRNNSVVNPVSVRLNPKSKSNLAPIIRRMSNWGKKIAMPLRIFNFALPISHSQTGTCPQCCPESGPEVTKRASHSVFSCRSSSENRS